MKCDLLGFLSWMSDFFELEIFSTISEEIIEFSEYLKSNSNSLVEISGPATISGIIGLAFIESALIDLDFRYSRTFHGKDELDENIFCVSIGNQARVFNPISVNLHMGHDGSVRTGVLDTIAQIGTLALSLNPSGRTSELEPWLLSGSWLRSTLDMVYNPVYTSLRDYLRSGGVISVVCMPEVPEIDGMSMPGIDLELLANARKNWRDFDEDKKAELMGDLAAPLISKSKFSVQRIEELCWNRIMKKGWKLDLASQCSIANRELSDSKNKYLSASVMLDGLISSSRFFD